MKFAALISIIIFSIGLTAQAQASQLNRVFITKISTHAREGKEWVRIQVDGQANNGACLSNEYARESDDIGRGYMSLALYAMAAKKPIVISGDGSCTGAYSAEKLTGLTVCESTAADSCL